MLVIGKLFYIYIFLCGKVYFKFILINENKVACFDIKYKLASLPLGNELLGCVLRAAPVLNLQGTSRSSYIKRCDVTDDPVSKQL